MIYSNVEFVALLFLSLVSYFLARSHTGRFWTLLLTSALYYVWTGWFDTLIFALVLFASWSAVALSVRFPKRRGRILAAGIVIMTCHLFIWKYLSWTVSELQGIFPTVAGGKALKLALPLGISFYTLQKIAYMVDVYKGVAAPVPLSEFLLFNGFFGQLIAGPITRANQLIPQLRGLRRLEVDNLASGVMLFAMGFFKKVAIGDNLATFVDPTFRRPGIYSASYLMLAVLMFTTEMWADFSGYTDMGRGAARMFGIHLPENFKSPFLAAGPAEFWRRWHITLSQWIRDYLFIPLAVQHSSKAWICFTLVLTMFLAGLWHGAGWHFVLYGFYWGLLLVGEHYWRKLRRRWQPDEASPGSLRWSGAVAFTFVCVLFSRLLFRVEDLSALKTYLSSMADNRGGFGGGEGIAISLMGVALAIQILTYEPLEGKTMPIWRKLFEGATGRVFHPTKWSVSAQRIMGVAVGSLVGALLVGSVLLKLNDSGTPFIYFQF